MATQRCYGPGAPRCAATAPSARVAQTIATHRLRPRRSYGPFCIRLPARPHRAGPPPLTACSPVAPRAAAAARHLGKLRPFVLSGTLSTASTRQPGAPSGRFHWPSASSTPVRNWITYSRRAKGRYFSGVRGRFWAKANPGRFGLQVEPGRLGIYPAPLAHCWRITRSAGGQYNAGETGGAIRVLFFRRGRGTVFPVAMPEARKVHKLLQFWRSGRPRVSKNAPFGF